MAWLDAFKVWTTLIALSFLLATGSYLLIPERLPLLQRRSDALANAASESGFVVVDAMQTKEIISSGLRLLLDARPTIAFQEGHLPTALSFPNANRDRAYLELSPILSPEQPLVVYCSSATCDDALELAKFLTSMGHKDIVLYLGGVADWVENGGELDQ
jgi:rhodanese-related sulfurtransferase